jgi:chemotaxis protein MotB
MLLVQGLASSSLFAPADPHSPANRRISIIVMNREAEERLLHAPIGGASSEPAVEAAPSERTVLSVPEPKPR